MSREKDNLRDESLVHHAAQDARATEARMLPSKGKLSPDHLAYVRKCIDERCDQQSLTYEQIDKKVGCGRKATRRFMDGNYEYDETRFARKLDNWLKNSDPNLGGMPQSYVSTEVAEKMRGVIKQVYRRRSMGIISGPAGVSKTVVLKYIAAGDIAGAIHIELTSADATRSQVLSRVAYELGLPDQYSAPRLIRKIISYLRGTDRMLLIDEAHYANEQGLNALRDVHKQTGCPVMFVGTNEISARVNDFDQFRGQMKSLISMVYDISSEANLSGDPIYSVDDMRDYANAMGIKLDICAAGYLSDLSSTLGWGGLRSAAYLLLNANLVAKGKPITEGLLKKTLRDMEGYEGYTRTESRVKSSKSQKVAVA